MVNGEFLGAINCVLTDGVLSTSAVLMVMFSGLGIGLYVHSGGIALPAVVLTLFAGVLLSMLPGIFTTVGMLLIVAAVGIGGVILFRRVR